MEMNYSKAHKILVNVSLTICVISLVIGLYLKFDGNNLKNDSYNALLKTGQVVSFVALFVAVTAMIFTDGCAPKIRRLAFAIFLFACGAFLINFFAEMRKPDWLMNEEKSGLQSKPTPNDTSGLK